MDFNLNRWVSITSAAEWGARNSHRVVEANGYLYLTGGFVSGVADSEVWRSSDGVSWTLLTSTPGWGARGTHGFLFYGNKLWVFGGYDGTIEYNDVWSSSDGITWNRETASAAWSTRHEFASCVHDGKMYISGGFNGFPSPLGTYYSEVYSSTDGITWSLETSSFGQTMRQHFMISYIGDIWIYGGNTNSSTNFNQIRRSTDDGANWSVVGTLAFGARKDLRLVVNDTADQIATIGGRTQTSVYDDAWVSAGGISFTVVPQVVSRPARYSTDIVYFNKNVHMFGGRSGSTDYNDVWKEQYVVTYSANGGTSPPVDTNLYDPENTVTVLDPGVMGREWYTFNSWNTAHDGSGVSYDPSDTFSMVSSVILYAQWDEEALPSVYYVEAVGSSTLPYDTRVKASPTIHNLYNTLPDYAWHSGVEVRVFGAISEPDEEDCFEMPDVKIIGESSQTTVLNMSTNTMEGQSLYNCTFFTDESSAEWKICIDDPKEVQSCIFDGRGLWSGALDISTVKVNTKVIGNSFDNFKEDAVYIGDSPVGGFGDLLVINNSFDRSQCWIDINNSTANVFHFYNNAVANGLFYIELTSMVITEFLHDHNLSTGGYTYAEDGSPFAADVSEIITDPLYLGTDPVNLLAIDETSPAYNAGVSRSTAPTTDLMGLTLSDPYSIGAYSVNVALPVVSEFMASPLLSQINEVIQFTDLSSGNPTSWDWDFGDGTAHSNDQNPTHSYASIGIYTISLLVSNGVYQDEEVKVYYVEITVEDTGTGFVRDRGPTLIFD